MNGIGRCRWAIAMPPIPARGSGPEPEFTSHDLLCLLNPGDRHADLRMQLLYAAHGPVGPYRLAVASRRVRHLRLNDLIFPEALRLEEAYGLRIDSNVPVLVQLTRQDTRQRDNAGLMTTAWSA